VSVPCVVDQWRREGVGGLRIRQSAFESSRLPARSYYFMVPSAPDAGSFFHFVVTSALLSLAYQALGVLCGTLLPTVASALLAGLFACAVLVLFGGLFVPGSAVPAGWRWLYAANPLRYAFEAVLARQFFCPQSGIDAGTCPTFDYAPNVPINDVPLWTFVAAQTNASDAHTWVNLGIVLAFYAAYLALTLVARSFISHIRR
jgi:ABC-type multidrug transport system permease subunit